MVADSQIIEQTRQWVENVVVGQNLCPFAAPVVRKETIRYALCGAQDNAVIVAEFLTELDRLQQAEETALSTTLLIIPALEDFYQYLDVLNVMQKKLKRAGLEGVFQLASFHPDYLFAGVPEDDRSHWTNRAPYATVHIIREGEMSRALAHYKNPEQIPERNMQRLRDMSDEQARSLYPHLFEDK